MGQLKKYITCDISIPFHLCHILSIFTFPVLISKNNKLWTEIKKSFCIYDYFSVLHYEKGDKNGIFRQNRILRHACMYV